jgi:hypothetical protein
VLFEATFVPRASAPKAVMPLPPKAASPVLLRNLVPCASKVVEFEFVNPVPVVFIAPAMTHPTPLFSNVSPWERTSAIPELERLFA